MKCAFHLSGESCDALQGPTVPTVAALAPSAAIVDTGKHSGNAVVADSQSCHAGPSLPRGVIKKEEVCLVDSPAPPEEVHVPADPADPALTQQPPKKPKFGLAALGDAGFIARRPFPHSTTETSNPLNNPFHVWHCLVPGICFVDVRVV